MSMREMQHPNAGTARRVDGFCRDNTDYRIRLAFALRVQAARIARRARQMMRINPAVADLLKAESTRLERDAASVVSILPRFAVAIPSQRMARAFKLPALTASLMVMGAVTFAGGRGIAAASPVWLVSHNARTVTASKQSTPADSLSTGFRVGSANGLAASVPVDLKVAGVALLNAPPARVNVCSGRNFAAEQKMGIAALEHKPVVTFIPRIVTATKRSTAAMLSGGDRFAALSMVETGNDDKTIGSAGEVSRFQIRQDVWRHYCALDPVRAGVNPFTAAAVAQAIMQDRCKAFETRWHRSPSDFEFYVLWNRPAVLLAGTRSLHRAERDRAQRFANLCTTL